MYVPQSSPYDYKDLRADCGYTATAMYRVSTLTTILQLHLKNF